jgi:predicted transglutaminase-like cysteine proteinase
MRNLAEKVHSKVKRLFTYKSDKEQFPDFWDHWKSWADEVEANQLFSDDCDGFCLTCAELLIRQGAKPEDVTICDVTTETGGRHLVCVYGSWVLDNRYYYVPYWKDLNYEWRRSMRMDEPGTWRKTWSAYRKK